MDYAYECSFCDKSPLSSFFICCNCHVCCSECRSSKIAGHFPCKICRFGQVYCTEYFKHQKMVSSGSIDSIIKINGPIVVLPASRNAVTASRYFSSCLHCNSFEEHSKTWLMNCFVCSKCISRSRALEHYLREHNSTLICPMPPGSMVTFELIFQNFQCFELNLFAVLQMLDVSEESCSFDETECAIPSGNEKLFFLMGTKVPFISDSRNRKSRVIKIWAYANFDASMATYSLEVCGSKIDRPSIVFTGHPLCTNASVKTILDCKSESRQLSSKPEVLCVRQSLLERFLTDGMCLVNFFVHPSSKVEGKLCLNNIQSLT